LGSDGQLEDAARGWGARGTVLLPLPPTASASPDSGGVDAPGPLSHLIDALARLAVGDAMSHTLERMLEAMGGGGESGRASDSGTDSDGYTGDRDGEESKPVPPPVSLHAPAVPGHSGTARGAVSAVSVRPHARRADDGANDTVVATAATAVVGAPSPPLDAEGAAASAFAARKR